jgi:type I restriction enzyme, S subunit
MSKNTVLLDELMVHGQRSLDPRNSPTEEFELYSIPAYDKREPEQVLGNEVGSSKKIVEPGDLLLSRIVPHIRRAWVVPSASGKRQIASGEWIVFRHDLLEPRYLRHYVMGDTFHSQFMNTVAGVGGSLVRARPENVGRIEVPLPPLSEQKRIADILDKADSIRRKRQEALNEIETLSLSSYRHQFGHPIAASDSLPLGECVTMLSGGTPSKSNAAYWNGDFPWVSPKDMKVDYISSAEDHVTDLAFQETTLKKLPAEAILIVVRGMILAHTIPVALTDVPVAINQDMKALIANDGYDPHFLCWSLKAAHNYILGKVATAAHGTKRLEVEHLASFPIPQVTLSEQRHFARIVQKIRGSRNRLATGVPEDLFNSLVQRAFNGEL